MRNNEVQFAGEIQPRGCCYWLEVPSGDQKLFHRQVVKSESATIKIPELDFEIPLEAQRGSLSTLVRAADELQALQEERKKVDPQTTEACAKGDSPFTLILDDPAGNSFIENLYAPSHDPSLSIEFYEQQALLGYLVDPSQSTEEAISASDQMKRKPHGSAGHRAIALSNSAEIADALFRYSAPEELMIFLSTCGTCPAYCETRMFVTRIPYFQEVIVMASTWMPVVTAILSCSLVGGFLKKEKRLLCVKKIKDLGRDVIKSDSVKFQSLTWNWLSLQLLRG
ncbi:hypothetical protein Q3G72_034085 [Acer saccharum]|nr:hypothetical protein Q3G72_034085 [Acer saccharum]